MRGSIFKQETALKVFKKCFTAVIIFLLCAGQAKAFDQYYQNDKLSISVDMQKSDNDLYLLLSFDLEDGWHILYQNPGDVGVATSFKFFNAKGELVGISAPQKFVYEDILTQYGFENKAYYLFKLSDTMPMPKVEVSWTACNDYCDTGKKVFELVRQTTPGYEQAYLEAEKTFAKAFDKPLLSRTKGKKLILTAEGGLPSDTIHFIASEKGIFEAGNAQNLINGELVIQTNGLTKMPSNGYLLTKNGAFSVEIEEQEPYLPFLLLIAFVGGLLLNLMPCVFPVLSLKAIYLANNAQKKKGRYVRALLYVFGVVCSFISIAGVLYVFKKGGAMLGWGFQLQSPVFVCVMIVIFVLILLYLFNILKMKTDYAGKLLKVSELNSFLTGFFAVLIASPCTGPFMGALMGYALFESATVYFPVFVFLGLGYALPFALLELYPGLIKKILPRPGQWMVVVKYVLSIPVILTVVWLCWILYHQIKPNTNSDVWMPYAEEKVNAALENGEPVFIDFTAKWCLICLLNEKTTLESEAFMRAAKNNNIHLFKADWTNKNNEIFKALKLYNRSSVPVYIFYPKDEQNYLVLPQILTPDAVLSVIDEQ